jgi:peptidoglycan hydrolase-like protein with peptidoglycan-binding domain
MKKALSAAFAAVIISIPFAASAATFTSWLTVGSRGSEVTSLQTILVASGYLKVAPTGYFGALTRSAVMSYQKANGLEQVGGVGPKTRALLNAYAGVSSTAPVPILPPMTVNTPTSTPVSGNTSATTTVTVSTTTSVLPPTPTPPAPSPNDPPRVTLVSPSSIIPRVSTQTDFTVKTDKAANCRYGTQPGMALTYMTPFTYTGGTTHTSTLTNLSVDALYIYYVRCEDMSAHVSQDTTVSFSVTGK